MPHIAICDDEVSIVSFIEKTITENQQLFSDTTAFQAFLSGEKLWQTLQKGLRFDLIFLDICMDGLGGIDLGRRIREDLGDQTIQIIYISSEPSYKMDAVDIRCNGFLTKPLCPATILKEIKRLEQIMGIGEKSFYYRQGMETVQVYCRDILYFQSLGRKVEITTIRGKEEFYGKLNETEKSLNNGQFLRISQSFLIHYPYIKRRRPKAIIMADDATLTITEPYQQKVRAFFEKQVNLEVP